MVLRMIKTESPITDTYTGTELGLAIVDCQHESKVMIENDADVVGEGGGEAL